MHKLVSEIEDVTFFKMELACINMGFWQHSIRFCFLINRIHLEDGLLIEDKI